MDNMVGMDLNKSVDYLREDLKVSSPVDYSFTELNEVITFFLVSILEPRFERFSRAVFHLDHHVDGHELLSLLDEAVQCVFGELVAAY